MRGSFVYVRKETRSTGHLLEAGLTWTPSTALDAARTPASLATVIGDSNRGCRAEILPGNPADYAKRRTIAP